MNSAAPALFPVPRNAAKMRTELTDSDNPISYERNMTIFCVDANGHPLHGRG